MRPLLERGTEAQVRDLLRLALGDLDTIAAEPADHEEDAKLAHLYREMAARGARRIRERLRAQS